MISKYGINFLIILLLSINSFAQTSFFIQGKILNQENNSPVLFSTISLLSHDEVFQKSNPKKDGVFLLEGITKGSYVLKVQSPGFLDLLIPVNKLSANLYLGNLLLEKNTIALDEVVIHAKTNEKLIERKIGKVIINLNNDIINKGATIIDIMDNIPSIDVDENGTVSLRGSTAIKIYINGKPTQKQLNQLTLPTIEKIELINSPSAKWNSEGSSIINIILKKNKKKGLNITTNFKYGIGKFPKYKATVSGAYMAANISINSSIYYDRSKYYFTGLTQDFVNNIIQKTENNSKSSGTTFTFGMDYFPNNHNQLFINYKRNISAPEGISSFIINATNKNYHTTNYDYNSHDLNLGYKKILAGENHFLDIEAYFSWSPKESESEKISKDNIENTILFYDYHGSGNYSQFNIDYQKEIFAKHLLEIGVQSNFRKINQLLENRNISAEAFSNFTLNYHFSRSIFSGYLNYKATLNKWHLTTGLRVEHVKRDLSLNNENYNFAYTRFYPNLNLQNNFNKKNSLSLSYNQRLIRPQHWQLTTIPKYFSPTSYSIRNPKLKPSFINALELAYNCQLNKVNISTSIYYKSITDRISHIQKISPDNPNIYIFTLENIERDNTVGLELASRFKINNWYTSINTVAINNANLKTKIEDVITNQEYTSYQLRSYNKFNFNNHKFQLNFRYKGNAVFPQGKRNPLWKIDVGYHKKIVKGSCDITIKVLDIFNTYHPEYEIKTEGTYRLGLFKPESRQLKIVISYNFESNKIKNIHHKKRKSLEKRGVKGVQL